MHTECSELRPTPDNISQVARVHSLCVSVPNQSLVSKIDGRQCCSSVKKKKPKNKSWRSGMVGVEKCGLLSVECPNFVSRFLTSDVESVSGLCHSSPMMIPDVVSRVLFLRFAWVRMALVLMVVAAGWVFFMQLVCLGTFRVRVGPLGASV